MLIVLFASLDGYCPICNLDSGLRNTLLSWKINSEREKGRKWNCVFTMWLLLRRRSERAQG